MRLPAPLESDPQWSRLRAHDLEELWDSSVAPHVACSYQHRIRILKRAIRERIAPPARVFDVGCAQGTLGLLLAEEGYRVALVDVRERFLDYARARWERGEVTYHAGLLDAVIDAGAGFDCAVFTEVIEHIPSPATVLAQIADRLRGGGLLVMTTPNADYVASRLPSYGSVLQQEIDEMETNSADGDAHCFAYTMEELVAVVRSAGFRVEEASFALPFWVHGHMKTRHLHRMLHGISESFYGASLNAAGGLVASRERWARHACSTLVLIARR